MPDRLIIKNNEAIHFVTCTIVEWIDLLTRPEYKQIIIDSLNYCIHNKSLVVYGWVIMTNHIHLLMSSKNNEPQSDIIRDFKKHTSKLLSKEANHIAESRRQWMFREFKFQVDQKLKESPKHHYRIWQAGYYGKECDRIGNMAQQKLDYIHANPVRQMIVANPEDYICSSASAYCGGESLVDIEFLE